eukprot:COSAG01_NODE_96_length_26789_cov_36.697089_1_plen_113_part_00
MFSMFLVCCWGAVAGKWRARRIIDLGSNPTPTRARTYPLMSERLAHRARMHRVATRCQRCMVRRAHRQLPTSSPDDSVSTEAACCCVCRLPRAAARCWHGADQASDSDTGAA